MDQPIYGEYTVVAGEPPPPYVADNDSTAIRPVPEQQQPATTNSQKPATKHTAERVHLFVEPVHRDEEFEEAYSRAVAPMLAEEQRTARVNDLLGVSIITFLCCSPLFGIVAVAFSCATRNALRRGAFGEARRRQRVAVAANACGILLGVMAALIFLFANALEMNAFRRGALFWTNAAPNAVRDSVLPERQ